MYRWYEDSLICYAYISDVTTLKGFENEKSDFRRSRWFTRKWTLQELLAPPELVFFDQHWKRSCKKKDISEIIAEVTEIPWFYVSGGRDRFEGASIAQKLSWASRRQTTRREDLAYCLLGIFGINMPLLYGEGPKAFTRLQGEMIKHTRIKQYLPGDSTFPQIKTAVAFLLNHPPTLRLAAELIML